MILYSSIIGYSPLTVCMTLISVLSGTSFFQLWFSIVNLYIGFRINVIYEVRKSQVIKDVIFLPIINVILICFIIFLKWTALEY